MTKNEQIELVKKYHFWGIAAVVLIAALLGWFMASSALTQEFEANRSKRESVRSKVQQLSPSNPNEKFPTAVNDRKVGLVKEVRTVWQSKYDAQQPAFKWAAAQFGPAFAAEIERVGPDGTIASRFLELFQNRNADVLEENLFSIVEPRVQKGQGVGIAAKDEEESTGVWEGFVTWNDEPSKIQARYQSQSRPNSAFVHYALQDFNLLRNVLEIIHKTNEGAELHSEAVIKQINKLAIGQMTTWPLKQSSGDGSGAAEPPPEDNPDDPEAKKKADAKALIEGRFCDEYGFRLPAGADAPYAEFNIVPCELSVIIDQRKIQLFLSNCASAPIPLEVRKLDIRWIGDAQQPDVLESSLGDQTELRAYDIRLELQAMMFLYKSPDSNPLLALPEAEPSGDGIDPVDGNNVDPATTDPASTDPGNSDPAAIDPTDPAAATPDPSAPAVDPNDPTASPDPLAPAAPTGVDPAAAPGNP